jgi:hypothetical protein
MAKKADEKRKFGKGVIFVLFVLYVLYVDGGGFWNAEKMCKNNNKKCILAWTKEADEDEDGEEDGRRWKKEEKVVWMQVMGKLQVQIFCKDKQNKGKRVHKKWCSEREREVGGGGAVEEKETIEDER